MYNYIYITHIVFSVSVYFNAAVFVMGKDLIFFLFFLFFCSVTHSYLRYLNVN